MKAKIIICLFAVLISSSAMCQIVPVDENGHIIYTGIVAVDSAQNSEALYSKAKIWFANTFVSSNNVIQLDDENNKTIIGKAAIPVTHKAMGATHQSGHIHYTITFQARDGRYRYIITNFHHTGNSDVQDYGNCDKMINTKMKVWGVSMQKHFDQYLQQINDDMGLLIISLKKGMEVSNINNDDNW